MLRVTDEPPNAGNRFSTVSARHCGYDTEQDIRARTRRSEARANIRRSRPFVHQTECSGVVLDSNARGSFVSTVAPVVEPVNVILRALPGAMPISRFKAFVRKSLNGAAAWQPQPSAAESTTAPFSPSPGNWERCPR